MQAFHNDIAVKEKYLERVVAHAVADEIIQGTYWSHGRGCAVGCTIHGNDHKKYEKELGIPQILARLEDGIFEGLPHAIAKEWPGKFLSAIKVGADLSKVWPKFAIWLLTDIKHGVINFAKSDPKIKAIQAVSDLYTRSLTEEIDINTLSTVRNMVSDAYIDTAFYNIVASYATEAAYFAIECAYAASYASADVDGGAADDASAAAASYATYFAIECAYAASYASADVDGGAADDASAAAASYAASYAAYAARTPIFSQEAIRIIQADKLVELLKECE